MSVFSARSFWLPVLVTTLVAAFLGAVLARRGRQLERMLAEQVRTERNVASLRQETERATAERDELLSSPGAIERVAREEFGFAAPGEQVTEFVPRGPRPEPPVAVAGRASSPWRSALTWKQLPLAVPAAAFVVTALVCAVLNAAAARSERAT